MVAVVTGAGLGLERSSGRVIGSAGTLGDTQFGRYGENLTVNAATGNLFIDRTDEILIGRGPDAVLARTYNSLGDLSDDNGDNWRLNAQRRVVVSGSPNAAGSTVTRYDWDGSSVVYTWDVATAAYMAPPGPDAPDQLTFAANVWTWTDGNSRVTDTYDHLNGGRITATKDIDNNSLTYSYTGAYLTRVTTANGERTDLTWSGPNLINMVTTRSDGTTLTRVHYGYDSSWRLTMVSTDLSPDDNTIVDNARALTVYTYDGSSRRIASINQTGGAYLAITYVLVGSDYRIATLTQTTASGVTSQTSFAYDTINRVTTITDALGQVTKLAYDAAGQLRRIELPPLQAGLGGQVTQFTYYPNGDVETATDAGGRRTYYAYDPNGNLALTRDAAGNTATRTYDAGNRLLTETLYTVADPDGAGSGQPTQPLTTRYAYDAEGHLRFMVSAEGHVTESVYNAVGQRYALIEYRETSYNVSGLAPTTTLSEATLAAWVAAIPDKSVLYRTDTTYDFRGNVATERSASAASTSGSPNSTTTIVTYTYDQFGNLLTRQTTGVPNSEVFTYDGLGRLISSNDLNNAATSIVFTDGQNKVVTTSTNGFIQTSIYDLAGRLITSQESGPGFATATASYKYDALGRLRMVTDATNRKSYILYDAVGRKIADIAADGSLVEYRYDLSNNLTSTTAYATKLTASQLAALVDGSGNPATVALTSIRPPAHADDVWTWRLYDVAQRLIQTIDGTGATTSFSYDGASRLVSTTNYANRLSASTLTGLKDNANGVNLWPNPTNGTLWTGSNTVITAAGTINNVPAFQVAVDQASQYASVSMPLQSMAAGETLQFSLTFKAVGSTTTSVVGMFGSLTHPNADGGAYSATISGPGTINPRPGAVYPVWDLAGLSTSTPTTVTLTRTYTQAEGGRPYFYVEGWNTAALQSGDALIVSNPILTRSPPNQIILPTLDAAKDSVSRIFYDADGRVIGALDGAGYLTQVVYDEAGRKIKDSAYANLTTAGLRASGTFAQLLASVGNNARDAHTHYAYDNRGLLRYVLDANLRPTQFIYDATGQQTMLVESGASIAPAASYSLAYIQDQYISLGLGSHADTRYTAFVYDDAGRLAFTVDALDYVVRNSFDAMGRVAKETRFAATRGSTALTFADMTAWAVGQEANADNRIDRIVYDLAGRIAYRADAAGYVTEYRYDSEDRVTLQVRYADPYVLTDGTTKDSLAALIGPSIPASAVQESFSYDSVGRLSDSYDGLGTRTNYVYDALGRVTDATVAHGTADAATTRYVYDAAGRVASETRGYGQTEASTAGYTYDAFGNVLTTTDGRGFATTYAYDRIGNLLSVTRPIGASETAVTTYTHDAFGNVLTTTDPRGNVSYSFYDKLNRSILEVDAEGYATATSYSIGNEILAVTRYATKVAGAITPGTPPTITINAAQDAVTSFIVNRLGRVAQVTDAMGGYEQYGWNAFGDRISVRNKLGGWTTNLYDKRGLLVSETLPINSTLNDGTVQASTVTNSFAYDARGNRIQMIEAAGLTEQRTTTYVYDKLDRLIETIGQTFMSQTPHEYIRYDARGNVTSSVDAAGARTLFYYDDLDRRTVAIGPTGAYSKYSHDDNGNVIELRVFDTLVTVPSDGGSEEEAPAQPAGTWRTTAFEYDRLNRLTSSTVNAVTSGAWNGTSWANASTTLVTAYAYDANGNVTVATDPNGNTIHSYYDKLGRKTAELDTERYLTTWTHDAEGNVLKETRFATKFAGTVPAPEPTDPSVTPHADDRVTEFSYDRNGNRLSETRWNVKVHNGSGGVSTVHAAIGYLYNGLGQVVRKTEATGDQVNYTYDSGGRLIEEKRAQFTSHQGTAVTPEVDYAYDGLGNITRTVAAGAGDALQRVTRYGYDGGKLRWTQDANSITHYYWYDIAGRVTYSDQVRRYDSSGAMTNDWEATCYVYDAAGRVTQQWIGTNNGSVWSDFGPRTITSYNAHGEVVSVNVGSAATAQQQNKYDAAGRLWASSAEDGTWKYFGYDKNGNRTLAIAGAGEAMAGLTFAQALAKVSESDVNATYTSYDKRGQATSALEEGRQLSSGTTQSLTSGRTYNAFGEVATETNAAGATAAYSYNTMGRTIRSESPTVSITLEDGSSRWIKPSQDYYYDVSGRLVATRDANGTYATGGTSTAGTSKAANTGNLTRLTLLAGTGYGGAEALVTTETRADGGVARTDYDIHADARKLTDGLNRVTLQSFDRMGRLTAVARPSGFTDSYAYDERGQRIKHWNSFLGTGNMERTDYDAQGRITRQIALGDIETTIAYSWNAALATAGTGTFGGWTETTTYENGKTGIEKKDIFGRLVETTDLGNHKTGYFYDAAGRMIEYRDTTAAPTGGAAVTFAWLNTGRRSSVTNAQGTTTFGYDAAGNIASEVMTGGGITYKNQTASYDALGRLVDWSDAGGTTVPTASQHLEYDASGNVRYRRSIWRNTVGGTQFTYHDWFRYDALDRLVTDRGRLSGTAGAVGTTVVRGASDPLTGDYAGVDYTYNLAGDRVTATSSAYYRYTGWGPGGPGEGTYYTNHPVQLTNRTDYQYNLDGQQTETGKTNDSFGWSGYDPVAITGARVVATAYTRDAMGRVISQAGGGSTTSFTYNAANQVATQTTVSGSTTTTTTNHYSDTGGLYYLGQVARQVTVQGANTQTQVNSVAWHGAAVRSQIVVSGTGQQSNGTTTHTLDAFGQVTAASIAGGSSATETYLYDAAGQGIAHATTIGGSTSTERWYRMGGIEMWHPSSRYAHYQGDAAGSYTVEAGDTLHSIAQALWGDANLWYKIAEANGLTAESLLSPNQVLAIPAGVWRIHQTADTFRPYDAARFLGDTTPSPLYPTPKGSGDDCGAFGQILLIVVAVAVTVVLPHVAPAVFGGGVLGGAAAGVAGSVVSQGVGLATGIQDEFSWKQVALAGIAGGIGGGLSGANAFGEATTLAKIGSAAVRGVAGNVLTQGVALATGLQGKFDWAGVAVGGVVGGTVGGLDLPGFGGGLLGGTAGAIAGAASRSLLTGTSFGDNIIRSLPDVIGATIGNALGDAVNGAVDAARLGRNPVGDFPMLAAGEEWSLAGIFEKGADAVRAVRDFFRNGSRAASSDLVQLKNHARQTFSRLTGEAEEILVTARQWYDGVRKDWGPTADRITMAIGRADNVAATNQPGVRTGAGYDRMGQPLNGRSNYNRFTQLNNILSDAGNVSLGTTLGRLGELATYTVPDAAQRNAEIFDPYRGLSGNNRTAAVQLDRLRGGTISGISTGVSIQLGADQATQDFVYGLSSSADGLLIARGGMAGVRVPGIGNQFRLNVVNGENGFHANSRLSGRTTWLYELQTIDGQFLKYGISVNPNTRYSDSFMVGKRIDPITSGTRADMLALERQMVIVNPGPLNREPWAVKARGGN